MRSCFFMVVCLWLVSSLATGDLDQRYCSSSSDDGKTCTTPLSLHDDECKLYLAPSTIPNAGLGVFTTVPLTKGHVLDGDVIIPALRLNTTQWDNPFEHFNWNAESVGMTMETNNDNDIEGSCPGLDAVLNCHFGLLNVKRGEWTYNDDIGGSRGVSPSSGSMTPYHDCKSITSQNVVAGGELFKSYGKQWFEERVDMVGLVPFPHDFTFAERLLHKLQTLEHKFNLSESTRMDLFRLMTNVPFESRTTNALPRDYMHVDTIRNTSIRAWYEQNSTRTTKELQETGRCIDSIRHGPSTLLFAGRGAFATRSFHKGEIITGSPLIHVPTLEMAVLLHNTPNETTHADNNINTTHYQLWINYCMGHKEGNMLLCPYGLGVNYMNHNQTLANVKLQWAPNGTLSQDDSWFLKSRWTRREVVVTHLAMDYIATRDIEEGEELFLDYGNEYEKAWQNHVENWNPSEQDKTYISARQWNKMHATDKLRTQQEQAANPYPSNLLLRCHPLFRQTRWKSLGKTDLMWKSGDNGLECRILDRIHSEKDDSILYKVIMVEQNATRKNVPRSMLKIVDAPHTTDWHRRESFRHYIGIPDALFPEAWRNRVAEEVKVR